MKETSLKAGNFVMYVKKATEFIPCLRFNAGCTQIVLKVCKNLKIRLGAGHYQGMLAPVGPAP